jgi:hypothetical protein
VQGKQVSRNNENAQPQHAVDGTVRAMTAQKSCRVMDSKGSRKSKDDA